MEIFPGLTPWNILQLKLSHYLALTARVDARRREAKEANRRGR